MKKTFRLLFAAAALLGFAACADVPELPYPLPHGGNGGGDDVTSGSLPFTSASLNDFTVQTIEGLDWSLGSTYAKATGYADGSTTATRTWLVSPAINTTVSGSEGIAISFDNVLRYVKSSTDLKGWHKVLASKDYNGDVTTATWTDLGFQPVESATQTWDFYAANPVALPDDFINQEKVYIAFYFQCDGTNSTTWEMKNLTIAEGSVTPTPPGPIGGEGSGTKDDPYDVTAVKSMGASSSPVWVKGYIVGATLDGAKALSDAVFGTEGVAASNILIAATTDANTTDACLPVQLPSGSVRSVINLQNHPENLGKEVYLYGTIEAYFGATGVKNVSDYVLDGKGQSDSSDATAVTVAEFNAKTPDGQWYILTGVVSGIKDTDVYGNFDLTDETGSVYVYGLLSEKGGAKQQFQDLVARTGLKNTDTIKIIGQRGEYNGKIEVTSAYFVEIVASGEGGEGGGDDQGGDDEAKGDGTAASPYNVAYVRAAGSPGNAAWVKGYIVGTIKDGAKNYSDAVFGTADASNTNILLADNASCTDASKCIPVQLPAGAVRNALSLQQHPDNLGKFVSLNGTLEKYFGQPGLKNISEYSFDENGGGNDDGGNDDGGQDVGDEVTVPFTADFTKGACGFKAQDIALGTLSYVWAQSASYGWKGSAYKTGNVAADSWLISPVVDLTSASTATLTFNQAVNYINGNAFADFLTVCVSTDYSGNASTATWTALTVPTWPAGTNWDFVDSGDISLAAFAGQKVTIAFHYTSTDATAPTWEVKNLSIK